VSFREARDRKIVGLKQFGMSKSTYEKRQEFRTAKHSNHQMHPQLSHPSLRGGREGEAASVFSMPVPRVSIEEMEDEAREQTLTNPVLLMFLGLESAVKVMSYFLITLETVVTTLATVGLTCMWYFRYRDDPTWSAGLDFILLAFAVVSPISAAIAMAYTRRERALIMIGDFRSSAYSLYLAHATWGWPENGGRAGAEARGDIVWIEHCDAVLAQLIGIGDELARFLSLPTATKGRHRMTRQGRREAARIMEVSYYLIESFVTQRLTRLMFYSERIKKAGLPAGEMSRLRQYERFIFYSLEQLRMIKLYRTPQSLRSFARIFTMILPPFYSAAFARVAIGTHSLAMGILFGIITALGLSALFESLEVLEDPFTAYLALDGIDVKEEFEVLHYAQLVSARRLCFPDAPPYPPGRRAALLPSSSVPAKHRHLIGQPPTQGYHHAAPPAAQQHGRARSRVPSQVEILHQPPSVLSDSDENLVLLDEEADDDTAGVDHVDLELGTLGDDEGGGGGGGAATTAGRGAAFRPYEDEWTVAAVDASASVRTIHSGRHQGQQQQQQHHRRPRATQSLHHVRRATSPVPVAWLPPPELSRRRTAGQP
jgi:hypothetical protein